MKKVKRTIGRVDKADFPSLNLENIHVKIDTGAYGCSIHCDHIEEIVLEGQKALRFQLLDPKHPAYNHRQYTVHNYSEKVVKSSTGIPEKRFVVKADILLFNQLYPIKLSLTNRGEMKYPVLLGRTLLNGQFVVDSAKKNLSYKLKTEIAQ